MVHDSLQDMFIPIYPEAGNVIDFPCFSPSCDWFDSAVNFQPGAAKSAPIDYIVDMRGGDAGIAFDRLDADQLPGGEAELREIWADMVAEAQASEDSRLDVTYTELF